jgi:hypothetical protein
MTISAPRGRIHGIGPNDYQLAEITQSKLPLITLADCHGGRNAVRENPNTLDLLHSTAGLAVGVL